MSDSGSSTGFFTDRLAGTRVPTNDLEGLMDCARYNEAGDMDLLREYLTKNPDEINAQDGQGRTVVHMAAANGHLDVLHALLEFNPKPNMQNEEGNSALHFAALNNRVAVASLLLEKGWKASLKNNFHKTPLQLISLEKGFDEMETLLLQHDDSLDDAGVKCIVRESQHSPSPSERENQKASGSPELTRQGEPSNNRATGAKPPTSASAAPPATVAGGKKRPPPPPAGSHGSSAGAASAPPPSCTAKKAPAPAAEVVSNEGLLGSVNMDGVE